MTDNPTRNELIATWEKEREELYLRAEILNIPVSQVIQLMQIEKMDEILLALLDLQVTNHY